MFAILAAQHLGAHAACLGGNFGSVAKATTSFLPTSFRIPCRFAVAAGPSCRQHRSFLPTHGKTCCSVGVGTCHHVPTSNICCSACRRCLQCPDGQAQNHHWFLHQVWSPQNGAHVMTYCKTSSLRIIGYSKLAILRNLPQPCYTGSNLSSIGGSKILRVVQKVVLGWDSQVFFSNFQGASCNRKQETWTCRKDYGNLAEGFSTQPLGTKKETKKTILVQSASFQPSYD